MPNPSVLQQVLGSFSRKESVRIRDLANVESIISTIMDGGPKSLQVITDFDQTITRFHKDGQSCDSTYGVLQRTSSEDYKQLMNELFEKYHPIEIDHEMSVEEKIPHMIRWYTESHEAMLSSQFNKQILKSLVRESSAFLRENARETLEILNQAGIPVLVFSAGIGDILQEILVQQDAYFPNMKIVSNWMKFDDAEALVGFKEPIIHTFNKNESVLGHEADYFLDLSHRGNAILMGDSDGDIHMGAGLQNPGAMLKIGFLNVNIEGRLDLFMEHFDIVLLDDQSTDFVNLLLEFLLNHKS